MCCVYCGGDEVFTSIGVGLLGYDTYKTTPGGCANLSRSYLDIQSCPCFAPRVFSLERYVQALAIGFEVKGIR